MRGLPGSDVVLGSNNASAPVHAAQVASELALVETLVQWDPFASPTQGLVDATCL